jgi:hypothetical protein
VSAKDKSPWAKAARTRKRNKRAKERAERERSARAKRAALIRWYGSAKYPKKTDKKTSKKRIYPKKKQPSKKKPTPKKTPPKVSKKRRKPLSKSQLAKRRKLRELERQNQALKKKIELQKRREKYQRQQVKKLIEIPEEVKRYERFQGLHDLPAKMKHESSEEYASRLIKQLMGDSVYAHEAAIEYYKAISEMTEVHEGKVFTLFMSPTAA